MSKIGHARRRDASGWEMTGSASGHIVELMAMADREERARSAFAERRWAVAFAALSVARRDGDLDGEDLERLAVAAYMLGKDGDCEEAWIAANRVWSERGEAERAAGCAFRHALGLFFRDESLEHLFGDPGMVCGEGLDGPVSNEIEPAVSDMGNGKHLIMKQCGDHGGPHSNIVRPAP